MNKKTRNTVHNNRQVRIRETPEALQAGLSLKLLQPRKNQSHLVSHLICGSSCYHNKQL